MEAENPVDVVDHAVQIRFDRVRALSLPFRAERVAATEEDKSQREHQTYHCGDAEFFHVSNSLPVRIGSLAT